ncbi:hypothetical protein TSACC_2107 [Terrimicrobium sacchariphilum]|uniref:Uncharacterized protein n=1 Tax=Terrimicrobium sacchariphilum TaxID=690879 RepID=A0A146G2J7_TERSA|nr:hypothetical protein [Terrimicrobium sacchariphilum]GAT31713.1 hypothetical protein TSACC_2107 [Terrimicrobium sacchariphilum]
MPLSRLLLAACALPLMLHAQSADPAKPFSYADTVALVKERAVSLEQQRAAMANDPRFRTPSGDLAQGQKPEKSAPEGIFVTGPTQTNESYFIDGKEVQKSIPYCRILDPAFVRNPESLLPKVFENQPYGGNVIQLLVYHADQNQPAFKLVGKAEEIQHSQFPFKNGDLIVVSVVR